MPQTTVDALFEKQVRLSPNSVAVVVPADAAVPTRTVTYGEIELRAAQVAARLQSEGIAPGQLVALMMERSVEMVVAMLGVLKAGAAYVPLDPCHPRERLEYIMADTRARVCLSSHSLYQRARNLNARTVVVGASEGRPDAAGTGPRLGTASESPAYVMYTSGSTGRPKGVVVPHRAIVRLVRGQSFAQLDASRVLLHLAPPSFDAATFEVWGALLNGARCVLAPEASIPDLARLGEIIKQNGVTTVWLTASLFNTIIDHAPATLETVAEVLTGGEALSAPHVRRAQGLLPNVQLINGYGPTESTTFTCCYRIPSPVPAAWRSIPIGPPIAHTSVHVLDGTMREVARGEVGDLYIGGDGLALGYLNLPDLTAERFINSAHGRLYRTGDRARVLPAGALDFLGREDDQVKVRGYRIELGEIEATLRSAPAVANAVVALREDIPGDKRLVAYYTLAGGVEGLSPKSLREHLGARLPEYMVPSVFVQLDAIPLTPNGKADRHALPAPGQRRPALERPPLAPRSPLERWIAGLWREVLQVDEVGVHDRFFELGGTSIAAMRFLARLNEQTTAPIPALLLFRAPTIAELSAILDREYHALLPSGMDNAAVLPVGSTALADRAARRQRELLERRLRRRAN